MLSCIQRQLDNYLHLITDYPKDNVASHKTCYASDKPTKCTLKLYRARFLYIFVCFVNRSHFQYPTFSFILTTNPNEQHKHFCPYSMLQTIHHVSSYRCKQDFSSHVQNQNFVTATRCCVACIKIVHFKKDLQVSIIPYTV